MKIEYEKPRQVIHFAALEVGTVFKCPSYDTVYMKTNYTDENSIDLATGELDCFNDDTKVYPVDATLYVKE